MKNCTIYLLLAFISFQSYSQKIEGYVFDNKTNTPIYEAHLQVGKNLFTTDDKGYFSFNLNSSKSIKVSHVNYHKTTIKVNEKKILNIFLNPKRENLQEIQIISKKLQKTLNYQELPNFPKATHSFGSVLKKNKILVFAGDASFKANPEQERQKILFTGTNEFTGFMEYANQPKFTSVEGFNNNIMEYDLEQKNWVVYEKKVRKRANLNAVSYKGQVFLFGGKGRTNSKQFLDNKIEIFNTETKDISVDDVNPHQAVNFGTSVYKNKIILSGGSKKLNRKGEKEYTNEVHFYDTDSGYWYLLTNMEKGKETKSIVVDRTLYLLGGYRESVLNEIESYNLETDTWSKPGTLFKKMERPAITSNKEMIYLFDNGYLVTFNTKTKELKEYRVKLPLLNSEMFYKDNNLYILGGFKDKQFTITPSKKLVSISLDELKKTKITNIKVLQ